MFNENIDCDFQEFSAEQQTRSFISTVADKLYLSAPSDSTMKLAIKKGRGVVRASCRIASRVGTFVAEATAKNPVQAVRRLERQIKNQLDAWKMNRFEKTL